MDDLAVGEEVVLRFGDSPDVNWTLTRLVEGKNREHWRVDLNNARDTAVKAEVILPSGVDEKPVDAKRGERG
jgi:hypothetical protein